MQTARASTRRAALAAFLLFAAALFVVDPAEASRTTTDLRTNVAPSASLELPSLELVDPVDSSPRFGFGEDLGLLDPEAGPGGFVVFAVGTAQCELTYARNNPLKYVDPDGRAIETAWDLANVAMDVASLSTNIATGNVGGAVVDAVSLVVDGAAALAPGVPGGAGSIVKGLRGGARLAEAAETGISVYRSFDNAGNLVQYAGITNNLARRSAEHLAGKGIRIAELMGGLTRADAKNVEQALIVIHGLGRDGGSLMNKINSISKTTPAYADRLKRGLELLKKVGYDEKLLRKTADQLASSVAK